MKRGVILGIILIIAAIAVLVSMASEFSTYETFAQSAKFPEKSVKVVGVLSKDKSIDYDPIKDPNLFSFYMKDAEEEERKVIMRSAKPQDFEKSEKIVLTGRMQGEEFIASDMLLKCPSKYKDEEIFVRAETGKLN